MFYKHSSDNRRRTHFLLLHVSDGEKGFFFPGSHWCWNEAAVWLLFLLYLLWFHGHSYRCTSFLICEGWNTNRGLHIKTKGGWKSVASSPSVLWRAGESSASRFLQGNSFSFLCSVLSKQMRVATCEHRGDLHMSNIAAQPRRLCDQHRRIVIHVPHHMLQHEKSNLTELLYLGRPPVHFTSAATTEVGHEVFISVDWCQATEPTSQRAQHTASAVGFCCHLVLEWNITHSFSRRPWILSSVSHWCVTQNGRLYERTSTYVRK